MSRENKIANAKHENLPFTSHKNRGSPRKKERPNLPEGSAEVNQILSLYLPFGSIPNPIGDLDPAKVVKAWVDNGSPLVDGFIVFDMGWLK